MNRFEEDFNNLNTIYEQYLVEYSSQYTPRMAGGQQAAQQGSPSYRKGDLPMGAPGDAGSNLYSANQMSNTTSPVSDEEKPKNSHISKVDILAKIDEMLDEAESSGMDYAIHQLSSLKKFITDQ